MIIGGRLAAAFVSALLLGGCVEPSCTDEDYRRKVANTAEAMGSVVATAQQVVDLATHGRSLRTSLEDALDDAYGDATSIQGGFDAVQSPSESSDQLGKQLDDDMTTVTTTISALLTDVRRGQLSDLVQTAKPLRDVSPGLRGSSRSSERPVKKLFGVALGILTDIGGFVDIGDLVANGVIGSRFGMSLAWVVLVGTVGICLYAEMFGRVVALTNRPVFDLVRERLGERTALVNLLASGLITLLTLGAEIGGVALSPYGSCRSRGWRTSSGCWAWR